MRPDSQLGNSKPSQAGQGRRSGASLRIARGQVNQREREIEVPVFTLGSAGDCDLVLGDEQFPELYAYILRTHDGYRLRCLVAEPILTVNAEDMVIKQLEDGDRIRCGPYEFHFQKSANSVAQSSELPQSKTSPVDLPWVATDGQAQDGIETVHRLLHDIRSRVDGRTFTEALRRSA
ncbi:MULTISPECIES: FHA domain-containing protein [Pirellulaceae]|nr:MULTISPECIES: FHA domain-containing protein [Pirellulaceae]